MLLLIDFLLLLPRGSGDKAIPDNGKFDFREPDRARVGLSDVPRGPLDVARSQIRSARRRALRIRRQRSSCIYIYIYILLSLTLIPVKGAGGRRTPPALWACYWL